MAALLWPDVGEARARANLRQRLLRLKRASGVTLVTGEATISLAAPGVTHDLDGSDDVLADLDAGAAGEFGDWLQAQRQRRREARIDALAAAAAQAESRAEIETALGHAQLLVELEPLSEHAHRRLMRLHYLRGDSAASLVAYERCRAALARDLGVAPSEETELLRRQVSGGRSPTPASRLVPLTVQRPPRLIGRGSNWRVLREAWIERRPAIVTGEPGLGKTRLVTDLAATMGGALVVTARPGDARVPYALLSRFVRGWLDLQRRDPPPALRNELARLLPELGDTEPMRSKGDRARFVNAVVALLRTPSEPEAERPIRAVFIDDLQFADAASVETLQHLAAADGALAWVIAYRGGELAAEARALLEELASSGRACRCVLEPLSQTEVVELIDSLGIDLLDGAALGPAIARHTGGNPLFVLETLKALLAQAEHGRPGGTISGRLPVAANVAALVAQRLGRLSGAAARLARCAAIAGQDFSADLAARVLATPALDLADAWAELEAAQILRDGAFVHDLIFEAALASVPPAIARQLHGEIAADLETRAADPARIAQHWVEAGVQARALGAVLAAARAAGDSMRPREQAQFLWQAADIAARLGRDDEAFDALFESVDRLLSVDRALVTPALVERLQTCAHREAQRARVSNLRAELALHLGEHEAAARFAADAARLATQASDEATAVRARQLLAICASLRGEYTAAVDLMQPLVFWYERHATPRQSAEFHAHLALVLDTADRPDEALPHHHQAQALAVQSGERDLLPGVLSNLACNRIDVGDLAGALAALLDAERQRALHDELRGMGSGSAILLVGVLRDLGRFDEALRWGEIARGYVQDQSPGFAANLHNQLASTWLALGQFARAQQELALAARNQDAPDWVRSRSAQLEGRLKLALGKSMHEAIGRALALAPAGGRAAQREMTQLDQALTLEPSAALDVARRIAHDSALRGRRGTALAAHARASRFAAAAGAADAAREHAQAALALAADVVAYDFYLPELWLNAWRALASAAEPEPAGAALAQGVQWVRAAGAKHVPAEFRDSFLQRNPVNRALLTAASRELPGR